MGRSPSNRDPSFWEKYVWLKELKELKYRQHSFEAETQQGRPSSESLCETCPMDYEPYTTVSVPESLVKFASKHKETDSGFVGPKCWNEPDVVELQQTPNQPTPRPAYEGDLHFEDITYANMHPGPSHQKLADIRVELGLIQRYRKHAVFMAEVDDDRFFDKLDDDLSADEHELEYELHKVQKDTKELERQGQFTSDGNHHNAYSTSNPQYTSAFGTSPVAIKTAALQKSVDSQVPQVSLMYESPLHHHGASETSSVTSSYPSHTQEHISSPSRNSGSESSTSSQTEMAEGEIFHRVRQLRFEARDLRSEISSLRWKQTSMETRTDKEEEDILKSLRRVIATSDPLAAGVLIPPNLLFDAEKVISRRRDDLGPLLDDILRLEQDLNLTVYRLGQAEEELHQRYLRTSQTHTTTVRRSSNPSEDDSDDGSEGPTTHRLPPIGGDLQGTRNAKDYETDPTNTESNGEESQAGGAFDPSKIHPKYIELQDLIAMMNLKQERSFYFELKQAKLEDRKEQRAKVNLHLAKEDEEELQRLPEQIANLQEEEDRGLNEIERLRKRCLMKGIMDEKGKPVEKDHWSDDDEEEQREGEESLAALEAWIIKPAVARAQKPAARRIDWSGATYRQQQLSRDVIMKKIGELNSELCIGSKLDRLKPQQRVAIHHILDRKNRDEKDKDFRWVIAQIEPMFRQGPFRCATTFLRRTHNDSKESGTAGRTSSQVIEAPQVTLSPTAQNIEQSLSRETKDGSQQHDSPEVVVNPPSEAQQQSRPSVSAQSDLLQSKHPKTAISQTSGLRNSALTANTNGGLHGHGGGLESRIYPWIFGKLATSRSEVRLLAAIMQATGVPLLNSDPEQMAKQITWTWNVHGYPSLVDRDILMAARHSDVVESAELLRYDGYDKLLVKQVVGYAFDDMDRGPDVEAEKGYSDGYEGWLPDF